MSGPLPTSGAVRPVLLFDVNETLLDMGALDPFFERVLGQTETRADWFARLKETWLVGTTIGRYDDFGTLAVAALHWTAAAVEATVTAEDEADFRAALTRLPAYPDVHDGLAALGAAGFRLAALTNGTLDAARAQLAFADIDAHFEHVFSADEVAQYKPAPAPYRMAADRLGVETRDVWMIAAHPWDLAGAAAAGCATAFVARPGKTLHPLWPPPDFEAADLVALADALITAEGDVS